ncbi:MAG: methyltransferase domain-containing protein [Lachnospiraceae bacterium]
MEWSKIIQPPEYLTATRIALLNDEFAPLAVKHCGIEPGMKVLEVGCGTGCFSRWLSQATAGVSYVGLDQDELLIQNAQEMQGDNQISYHLASAFEMPFQDHSFDVVFSHTFLNCVEDPKKAMEEMKRVVKPGGRITSVTSMSLGCETWHTGYYPKECDWQDTIRIFEKKMLVTMEKLKCGPYALSKGYPASAMPHFFHESKLQEVHIFPIPRAFSLSNADMAEDKKQRYITQMTIGEKGRLHGAMEVPGFLETIKMQECADYEKALDAREVFWLSHLQENSIWEWYGSSALLVSGICS